MTALDRRFLIVVFDALRPDMVTPDLMPNLSAFAGDGVRFMHSRAAFPTETRVNQASLVTGCYPSNHGIVGNRFRDPIAAPGTLLETGDESALSDGDRRLGGRLIEVPTLGEILAGRGMNLAVVGTGSSGGTRILHHRAEQSGGFRLSLQRPDASVPTALDRALSDRIGPIPAREPMSLGWLTYAIDAYLDYVEPELAPEVAILWLCEPDSSYHDLGIGTAENLTAIRHVDAEFGRILAWRDASATGQNLQIVTLSDHGQLTVDGQPIDLNTCLTEAGYAVGETADLSLAVGSAGGIYLREYDADFVADIVAWLHDQPWCGPVSTREGRGCLAHEQIGLDHPRAPDIALVFRSDDTPNAQGIPGSTRHDSGYAAGCGLHGGLHDIELATWFAAQGTAFRRAAESALPTGIVDVMPTILHLLGIEAPEKMQGRVLHEALAAQAGTSAATAKEQTFVAESSTGLRTHLSVSTVGRTTYLNGGWVA